MKCPKCQKQVKGTGKAWIPEYRKHMMDIHIRDCDAPGKVLYLTREQMEQAVEAGLIPSGVLEQ